MIPHFPSSLRLVLHATSSLCTPKVIKTCLRAARGEARRCRETMEAGSAVKRPLVRYASLSRAPKFASRHGPCQDRCFPSFSQLIAPHGLLSPYFPLDVHRSDKTMITWIKRRAVYICTSALHSGCCGLQRALPSGGASSTRSTQKSGKCN